MKENKFIKVFKLLFLKKLNQFSLTEGFGQIYDANDFKFVLLNSNAKLKLVDWYYPTEFMTIFGNMKFISEKQKKQKRKVMTLYEELLSDESVMDVIHTYFIMTTTGYQFNTDEPICIISDIDTVEPFLQENCEILTKEIVDTLNFDVIDPNTINIFFSDYNVSTSSDYYFDPRLKLELKCVVGLKEGVDVYENEEDAEKYENEKVNIENEIFPFFEDRFDEWYVNVDLEILEL